MDAAASDPFFLDWGSSVNVNEDLRRTIRAEIEDIESDINKLQSSVKKEEKDSNQLTKDVAHARAEMMNLSRGATDDRDDSVMNEQIQMRLKDSLNAEVVAIVTPSRNPDSNNTSSRDASDVSPIPAMGSEDDSNERHLEKYLTKCAAEIKSLTTTMQQRKMSLDEYKAKLASIQNEINNVGNQIDRDQKTQSTWSEDVHDKTRELDIEKQRFRCVKEAIQRARKLNGHHAQSLADDVRILVFFSLFIRSFVHSILFLYIPIYFATFLPL